MVHIHGGGLFAGNGNGDYSLLANKGNEVVVSMNYRLGIFGFLATKALGANPGDYGLEDQQAALRWVQRNITAFGGDPRKVMIYGESGGASSVCDQIASPTAAGLFSKAFSISGEYSPLFSSPGLDLAGQDCKSKPPSESVADAAGQRFAAAVGCGGKPDVGRCLRAVPTETALQAASLGFTDEGTGTISPTLNRKVLPYSLRQALVNGKANRVPVVAGTDRDENIQIGHAFTADQYKQLIHQQFGRLAPAVLRVYPLDRFYSPYVAFRTAAADAYTVCPAIATERLFARRMPAWEYEVDFGDANVFEEPVFPANQPNGSYHIAGFYDMPNPNLDPNQLVLQQQEVASLTTFARTGDPTAKNTPLWPEFNHTKEVLSWQPGGDSELTTTAVMALNHNCRFWDSVSPKPFDNTH